MTDKCFKHPRRKAVCIWRICSDTGDKGLCLECDLELNKMGLKWAFPKNWRAKYEAYRKELEGQ